MPGYHSVRRKKLAKSHPLTSTCSHTRSLINSKRVIQRGSWDDTGPKGLSEAHGMIMKAWAALKKLNDFDQHVNWAQRVATWDWPAQLPVGHTGSSRTPLPWTVSHPPEWAFQWGSCLWVTHTLLYLRPLTQSSLDSALFGVSRHVLVKSSLCYIASSRTTWAVWDQKKKWKIRVFSQNH